MTVDGEGEGVYKYDGQVGAVGIHLDGQPPAGVLDLALGGELPPVEQVEGTAGRVLLRPDIDCKCPGTAALCGCAAPEAAGTGPYLESFSL